MIRIKFSPLTIVLLFIPLVALPFQFKGQIPGIIHIHSTFSTGRDSIESIVQSAQNNGLKVIIMNDHNLIKFEYGLFPLRNLIRKSVSQSSILLHKPEKYLKEIELLNKRYPDILIIPGCEVACFYYWEGSLLKRQLQLKDWDRHLLLIGLDDTEDFRQIPQIGSRANRAFRLSSLLYLWPIALFVIGWKLKNYKKEEKVKLKLMVVKRKKTYRWQGILLIIISVIFIINYFPFTKESYNIHEGYAGYAPYQQVIDFAQKKNILVYWAHPESKNSRDYDIVKFTTDKYPEALIKTSGYNGFAALYEGWRECAKPGGYWDAVLTDFLKGKRDNPIWCIGELDYHYEGESGKTIDQVQTIFLANTINNESILNCLKNGKMYAVRRTKDYCLRLDKFYITASNAKAFSGELISADDYPHIVAHISTFPKRENRITAKLIRNGKIIKQIRASSPIQFDYIDTKAKPYSYYRLDISTQYPHQLYSNPIFFKLKGKK
jgi:hypothetical protein